MKSKAGFTKRDVVVVLGCAIFVLMNIGAVGHRGRERAKEAVCLSNLLQMGKAALMFTNDNDGYFQVGNYSSATHQATHWDHWASAWEPYYVRPNLRCCPVAVIPRYDKDGNPTDIENPFAAWGISGGGDDNRWIRGGHYGSYTINGYVCNKPTAPDNWKTPHVAGAENIPLMSDGMWIDSWPWHNDGPPEYENVHYLVTGGMGRFCVNRHNGAVNVVFLDWSARKVGLKELWKLKWCRSYDVNGPWTIAGGATPDDWANHGTGWMVNFKDF